MTNILKSSTTSSKWNQWLPFLQSIPRAFIHKPAKQIVEEKFNYDVIVVGGGHAGCEAATAAARVGAKTLLLTHKISTIGEMSCNPSFGGIGKGHLIKEIDALDGVCGRMCDISGIQYRMLNRSKGPAVWGPRAQIDRDLYRSNMQKEIFNTANLEVLQSSVEDLITSDVNSVSEAHAGPDTKCRCVGAVLGDGTEIFSSSVVLTAGTFLRGRINIGLKVKEAGRMGDSPAVGLAKTIEDLGFTMGRLKTGTPPRIAASSIDVSGMVPWHGDTPPQPFSFENDKVWINAADQLLCYTTNTKPALKQLVLDTLHVNKHVKEELIGPRYCPSIESKVLRFADQNYHCWIEPEGLNSDLIYLQGFSCTLPEEYQDQAVRLVDGLERAEIVRYGYGVEYDYMDPRQVAPTLQTYKVLGLYFAGQINGTTGYEEAAAQGLIAGVNAARMVKGMSDFIISRSEGYIGVLIDDLTTLGTNEPYRMFTSRSEFRMSLRPDNADERLTERGFRDGACVGEERHENTKSRLQILNRAIEDLKCIRKSTNSWRKLVGLKQVIETCTSKSGLEFIGDNHDQSCSVDKLMDLTPHTREVMENYWLFERLKAEALYCNLLPRQQRNIEILRQEESLVIPNSMDYNKLQLKLEIREKLAKARPQNIAAATRIQGVTPVALVELLLYIKKLNNTAAVS